MNRPYEHVVQCREGVKRDIACYERERVRALEIVRRDDLQAASRRSEVQRTHRRETRAAERLEQSQTQRALKEGNDCRRWQITIFSSVCVQLPFPIFLLEM